MGAKKKGINQLMDYKVVQVFTKKETLILVSFRKSSKILNNILSVLYLERASSDSSVNEVAKRGPKLRKFDKFVHHELRINKLQYHFNIIRY